MESKGISQADICRDLDVSSATVSEWCAGKKYPRIDMMQRLADLLGVKYSTLTTSDGLNDYEDQQRLEALHQNPRLGLLFDRIVRMSPEDQETMIAVSASITKEFDGE
jgi:repressor LexA